MKHWRIQIAFVFAILISSVTFAQDGQQEDLASFQNCISRQLNDFKTLIKNKKLEFLIDASTESTYVKLILSKGYNEYDARQSKGNNKNLALSILTTSSGVVLMSTSYIAEHTDLGLKLGSYRKIFSKGSGWLGIGLAGVGVIWLMAEGKQKVDAYQTQRTIQQILHQNELSDVYAGLSESSSSDIDQIILQSIRVCNDIKNETEVLPALLSRKFKSTIDGASDSTKTIMLQRALSK